MRLFRVLLIVAISLLALADIALVLDFSSDIHIRRAYLAAADSRDSIDRSFAQESAKVEKRFAVGQTAIIIVIGGLCCAVVIVSKRIRTHII
jgi:hypothetical protein